MVYRAYQSLQLREAYLLVDKARGFDLVPNYILEKLGNLEFIGTLDTDSTSQFAGFSLVQIEPQLRANGYCMLHRNTQQQAVVGLAIVGAIIGALASGSTAAILGGLIGAYLGSKNRGR
jgi:uncharacterized protein YcgL (UPF0745 family)